MPVEKWEGQLSSAAEFDRLQNLYGPLAEAVRGLIDGFISDAQAPTVEAEGVFIEPAWARNGGGTGR